MCEIAFAGGKLESGPAVVFVIRKDGALRGHFDRVGFVIVLQTELGIVSRKPLSTAMVMVQR